MVVISEQDIYRFFLYGGLLCVFYAYESFGLKTFACFFVAGIEWFTGSTKEAMVVSFIGAACLTVLLLCADWSRSAIPLQMEAAREAAEANRQEAMRKNGVQMILHRYGLSDKQQRDLDQQRVERSKTASPPFVRVESFINASDRLVKLGSRVPGEGS